MRHAVLMIVYNNLELTKAAVASVLAQDIGPLDLTIVDNGSTDGTGDWLRELFVDDASTVWKGFNSENRSPIRIVNQMLPVIFGRGHTKVLGIPNDVRLRPDTYSQMTKWPRGIVTASMTDNPSFDIDSPIEVAATSECTPMAVALIRRWCYDALIAQDGYFMDERFFHYCSDCDMALRIASCGIRGVQLNIPYYHFGSASHRLATPEDSKRITDEADRDRQRFVDKWGFPVTAYEYGALAGDINFRGIGRVQNLDRGNDAS